jgi:SAM-dependent methyltransferase
VTAGHASGDVVAEFYERHPYPPPPPNLDAYRETWRSESRRRAEHHLLFPGAPYRADLKVLIAGCGTSQAVRHALRWPAGHVVGVDVSTASLRSTAKLGQRYGLGNLEVHELAIEDIRELGETFDLVVCTGVIHHLADPDRGLRALRAVLRPGGAANLMVYAPFGRVGVTMMQEYASLLDIEPERADIDDFAHVIADVPFDHPIVPLLRASPDFRHPDALADALLNPRERAYTVGELLAALDDAGFSFGRWYRQAPYLPHCGFPATSRHHRRLAALPIRSQYAALELLRGSMARHSVIAHRDDEARTDGRPSAEEWGDAVPIRLPDTLVVEERLPPGAAAVLINRSHTFTDLVLPVNEKQKRLFEAIDERQTIGALVSQAGTDDVPAAYEFFTKLWQHDQVVFDTSPGATS